MKVTPGYWQLSYANEPSLEVIVTHGPYEEPTFIATIETDNEGDGLVIAASKDLLRALKGLFRDGGGVPFAQWTQEQHAAFAAIQRAEGKK